MEEGGLLLYLRMLAVAYEKTQELARDLRAVGCGDLDVEALTESLFLAHKDEYPEHEQASLGQLYHAKMEEMRAENQQLSESSGTIGRSKGASVASSHQQISVTVVTEFVRWNEEAISRCTLFSSQLTFCVMGKGRGEVMGGSRFKFRCGEKRKKLFSTWRDKQINANGVRYGLSNTQMGSNFSNCRTGEQIAIPI